LIGFSTAFEGAFAGGEQVVRNLANGGSWSQDVRSAILSSILLQGGSEILSNGREILLAGGRLLRAGDNLADDLLGAFGGRQLATPDGLGDGRLLRSVLGRKTTTYTSQLPPGNGFADKFGNVTLSSLGSEVDKAQVRLHEGLHSFLSPDRNSFLAEIRADIRIGLYSRSQLFRFVEEALAETRAQIGTRNLTGLNFAEAIITGLRFPLDNNYKISTLGLTLETLGVSTVTGGIIYGGYQIGNQFTGREDSIR